jgi:hypothetical protein
MVSIVTNGVPLIINEQDLPVETRSKMRSASDGVAILGGEESQKALFDALPSVIAKRLTRMVPEGFALKEIELQFTVSGQLFGSGVAAEVHAKYSQK